MPKSAGEINAEKIEAIIVDYVARYRFSARGLARKIVEEFGELTPAQYTSERDGTSQIILTPMPWATNDG